MAKKEYFDGPFAWFFKAAGCISVDREHHGGNSKEIAEKVLNKKWALGIYPEGTRNSLASKEEKLKEAHEYLKEDMSLAKFKKITKKQMTLLSQYEFLKNLYNDNVITKEEFKKALLDLDNYLIKLVKDNKISKDTYKDTLLLPVKFGTVSLASKTNATIVPYAITGKYQFLNNKLTIKFGKTFKVSKEDNLEEVNEKLQNEIKNIILESKDI